MNTIFFDAGKGEYLVPADGRFIAVSWKDACRHILAGHLPWPAKATDDLPTNEASLVCVQRKNAIDYAGPLGGHRVGYTQTSSGHRVLVTSECSAFSAPVKKGSHGPWLSFLAQLLPEGQVDCFLDWLKVALESLLKGDFRAGQMVVFAGPPGCGKSLCQHLVTELLGGRSAQPYQYMTGETQFTGHLAGAEHFVIADVAANADIRSRRKFGEAIKELTVNLDLYVHPKGKQALSLPTFRRMTLSVNDEPENLAILPPWDDSLADKVMLFACDHSPVDPDRSAAWKAFADSLPAFRHFLLKSWKTPKARQDTRYGTKAYHHPVLLAAIADLAPENRLLSIIDEVLANEVAAPGGWRGTATALERVLARSEFSRQCDGLLHGSSSLCGVYLQRLTKSGRVWSTKCDGQTTWTIQGQKRAT